MRLHSIPMIAALLCVAAPGAFAASGKGTLKIEKIDDDHVRLSYCDDKGCLAPETVHADRDKLHNLAQKQIVLVTAKVGGDAVIVTGAATVGVGVGALAGGTWGLFGGGIATDVLADNFGIELASSTMIHVVMGGSAAIGGTYMGGSAAFGLANSALNPMPNVRAYRTLHAIRIYSDKPREIKGISRDEMESINEQLGKNALIEETPVAATAQ